MYLDTPLMHTRLDMFLKLQIAQKIKACTYISTLLLFIVSLKKDKYFEINATENVKVITHILIDYI